MDKKISVIIPVYKTEKYLDRCIRSIAENTYKNIEIILVDDGSPDDSITICEKWQNSDGRVKIVRKENGGAMSARLAGIEKAEGDYISFVDSDDWVASDMFEYFIALASEHKADVCSAGLVTVFEGEEREGDLFPADYDKNLKFYDFTQAYKNIGRSQL